MDTKMHGGHQPQTMCLVRFSKGHYSGYSASAFASTDGERLHPSRVKPME